MALKTAIVILIEIGISILLSYPKQIQELEEAKRILEYQLAELKHKVDQLEKKNQEAKVKRDAARQEEIKFYKKRAEHLKVSLYINLVSSPKHKKTNANSIHVL